MKQRATKMAWTMLMGMLSKVNLDSLSRILKRTLTTPNQREHMPNVCGGVSKATWCNSVTCAVHHSCAIASWMVSIFCTHCLICRVHDDVANLILDRPVWHDSDFGLQRFVLVQQAHGAVQAMCSGGASVQTLRVMRSPCQTCCNAAAMAAACSWVL